jgi:hypothetical protein
LRRAEPQSRRALTSSAIVGDIQTVGIGARHPAPPPHRGDRRRHPRPLCGSAPLRETNNAATITARSKSRSPTTPDRSRRAAEPQSAHLKRDRRRHPDRWHRRGTPSTPSASRRSSATPQTSLRLCGFARDKQRRNDHRPLEEPIAPPPRTGRAEPQSRRALTSSAGVEDFQTVGIGAGHPAPPPRHGDRRRHPRPLCGSAPLRETNNAATITARSKSRSPIPPDRSRRAAEPQSAHLKRDRRRHPDRWHRRGTPSTPSASRRSSATPQTSLRLCASAREKQRRDDHRPLEEPIVRHPPPPPLRVAEIFSELRSGEQLATPSTPPLSAAGTSRGANRPGSSPQPPPRAPGRTTTKT